MWEGNESQIWSSSFKSFFLAENRVVVSHSQKSDSSSAAAVSSASVATIFSFNVDGLNELSLHSSRKNAVPTIKSRTAYTRVVAFHLRSMALDMAEKGDGD